MFKSGLKLDAYSFKDHSYERIFGSAPSVVEVKPLGRDISGIPVVYQGDVNSCVACSITWVKQFKLKDGTRLSWPFLAKISNTGKDGASPKQVLSPAKSRGIAKWDTFELKSMMEAELEARNIAIEQYSFVTDYSTAGLYSALQGGVLAIGVLNFRGIGPHFLVAFDVTEDGQRLKCVNWWDESSQDVVEVDFKDVEIAVSFEEHSTIKTVPVQTVLVDKVVSFFKYGDLALLKQAFAVVITLMGLVQGIFGAGYTPVTGYESRTTSQIAAGASTIPVASVSDPAGNIISVAALSASSTARMYFNVEPGGTRQELFYCTGISSLTLTGCVGGLAFQGSDLATSSTLQKVHPAGSKIIMTNIGQSYNEYIAVSGAQTKFDLLTFNQLPQATSSSAVPTSNAEFVTKFYADTVGTAGLTAAAATSGLFAYSTLSNCSTTGTCLGVYISTTSSGLYFGGISSNQLLVQTSSTGGLVVNGSGRLVIDTSDSIIWDAYSLGVTGVPSTTTDVVNFGSMVGFYATGTAGTAIAAGDALRMGGDGNLYLTNANATNTIFEFVGIANNSTNAAGQKVTYVRPGGTYTTSTSQFAGQIAQEIYLTDVNGDYGITRGTVSGRIGTSLSANTIKVESPNFFNATSGSVRMTGGATTLFRAVTSTFTPSYVSIDAQSGFSSWCRGEWTSAGGVSSTVRGYGTTQTTTSTCQLVSANNSFTVLVVTSTVGFGFLYTNNGASPGEHVFNYYADNRDPYLTY